MLLLWLPVSSRAQFYTTGEEDGRLKWSQIRSAHYRVIYPAGIDSLARVYAGQLERYRNTVGHSAGYRPGEFYRRKTPVVLHAYNGVSNGSVAWAPMRMELYTLPQACKPGPLPWIQSLAVHESRHLAQMQFGKDKALKPFHLLFGEMFSGAASAVFPNLHLLEGDAVVAETALTEFGRGREADFLNYYRLAFDQGDWRSWYRWRYGSYRRYAPNHYALGYLTVAGARYCYDRPLFMQEYFHSAAARPYRLFHLQRTLRKASGKKPDASFREICETFHGLWTEEKAERAPFLPAVPLLPEAKWYCAYTETCMADGNLYAVKAGNTESARLVRIDSRLGKESVIRPFSANSGDIEPSAGRLWWSEAVPDLRWGLQMDCRIRYMDLKDNKVHDFTRHGRYFNPRLSGDEKTVAAVEYPVAGGSRLVQFDASTGALRESLDLPDSLQGVEAAWLGGEIVLSGISGKGMGLYLTEGRTLRKLLGPLPVKINGVAVRNGRILFVSDRNGANELYELQPEDGECRQLTSLTYGGENFCFNDRGDRLYFTAPAEKGRLLHSVAVSALRPRKIDFSKVHRYRVADRLTAQEKELARRDGLPWADSLDWRNFHSTAPERLRRFPGIFNFHSWAPLYVDYDPVAVLSADLFDNAGLGVTGFFQSVLGEAYGSLAYRWGRTSGDRRYRSSLHANFTYRGLYPVIEAKLHFGEREALQYHRAILTGGDTALVSVRAIRRKQPSFGGSIRTYVPLNLSSSGWNRGLIPQLSYRFSNDAFDRSPVVLSSEGSLTPTPFYHFSSYRKDRNLFMQSVALSVRAYAMQGTAPAREYPEYGLSGEIGTVARLGLSDLYSASAYAFFYGYLPGFAANQGFRLSAKFQRLFKGAWTFGETGIHFLPRGFAGEDCRTLLAEISSGQAAFSADYSLPVSLGDIDLFSPVVYLTHLTLKPYIDFTVIRADRRPRGGSLWSAGAECLVHTANLLWLPYDTAIGVTVCGNGGSLRNVLKSRGVETPGHYLSLVFRVSM